MGLWIPGGLSSSGGSSYVPCDWSTGTDEEIIEALEKHYAGEVDLHDYWTVGDERTVTLSAMSATGVGESHVAQDVVLVLSNVGGKYLSDGVTECAFQVDQKDTLDEQGYMNDPNAYIGNQTGWKDSARRTWCNNIYKNAIPSTLRGIFKNFINQSGKGNGSASGVENTTDTFALRAEIEVFGSTTYSVSGEGSQVEWYQTSNNRIKKQLGIYDSTWWERSPKIQDYQRFCYVIGFAGTAGENPAGNNAGLAPFGCI